MKTLSEILSRRDSLLTKEQWAVLENEIVVAARPALQGRRVFAGATKVLNDSGLIQVEWNEQTGMSAAVMSLMGDADTGADETDKTKKTLTIPVLEKNFTIPWRILEAARKRPTQFGPLEAENAADAARVVAELEDEMLAKGKGAYKGLTNATGIQTIAGGSWASDWARRKNNIVDARKELQDEGHYGVNGKYQLLVNPAEGAHFHKVTETAGRAILQDVQDIAEVVEWAQVPAGKAYLRDPSPTNADLIIGLDMRPVELPKTGLSYRGRVMEIIVPRVKRAKSICEITGIA